MNHIPDIFRILPEVVFTITGVVIMLVDASLPAATSRRSLGRIAALGAAIALWTSVG